MTSLNPIAILVLLFFALYWYLSETKKNQILCRYRRRNKTLIARFVKMQSRYVYFDNMKCDVIPSCVVWQWYPILFFFHLWVPTLDFSWNSPYPHDPNNLNINSVTPEIRNALNKEEWTLSFFKGARPSTSKASGKFGFIQQWLPILALLGIVVVFFYFNSKMQGFGSQLDLVIGKINSIVK